MNVGDDADDAGRLAAERDAAADGILAGDCVFASVSLTITTGSAPADIGGGECPAAEDRRSQRREVVRARDLKLRAANVRGRCRFADEREPLRHARSAERRAVAGAHPDRFDAGQRARHGAGPR